LIAISNANAHHLDAKIRGGFQVDIVEAGTAQRDKLRAAARQRFEDRGVRLVVDEDADSAMTCSKPNGILIERVVEIPEPMTSTRIRRVEKLAVVGLRAEYDNIHQLSPERRFAHGLAGPVAGYLPINTAAISTNRIFTMVIEGKIIA